MKQLITFLVFSFLLSNVYGQERIVEFSFGRANQIFSESIIIRRDSTFFTKGRGDNKETIKSLTAEETWERLIHSISQYSVKNLQNLPSPTHDRDYDGALFSGITISTNLKRYFCGDFDDYNPNGVLKPLLEIILESKKSNVR